MFSNKICIFGTGGFSKEVFLLAKDCGYQVSFFVDSSCNDKFKFNIPVLKEDDFDSDNYLAVIAIGSIEIRKRIVRKLKNKKTQFASLIHPSARIMGLSGKSDYNMIGEGAIISANCIITSDIIIGNFCQLNLSTTIGHDSVIGDFFTSAPGVHISGSNNIKDEVYFGTNASSIEKISITNNVIIGANACVTKDIDSPGTYVGVPAKKIK